MTRLRVLALSIFALGCASSGGGGPRTDGGGDGGLDGSTTDVGVALTSDAGPGDGGVDAPSCGNGVVEDGELCDGDCPAACNDGIACTTDALSGSASSCSAVCTAVAITSCIDDDGCCAAGCVAATDSDCSASCGNGTVEDGELCDGDCPASCDDGLACTNDAIVGSASSCSAACASSPIAACGDGDGCCAPGCDATSDADCSATCGNGVVETGETCDGDCPASCNDGMVCTRDVSVGSAASCSAECAFAPITACASGDGCCAPGCDATTDADCAPVCGNGVVESGESCDGACPTSCSDGLACTTDVLAGSATSCSARCTFGTVTACTDGDGCCPSACTSSFDDDCVCAPSASCDGRTCGTVDDGCGRLLRCGAECGTWTRVTRPPVAPGGVRLAHLGPQRLVFYSASGSRTFEYDGTSDSWTEQAVWPGPSGETISTLTYAGSGRVVALSPTGTWEYDATTHAWTGYAAPPVTFTNAIVHAGSGRVLAFGTTGPSPDFARLAVTYVYSTTTHVWTELALALQPPGRSSATLSWLGDGRLLLIGGLGTASGVTPVLDDAWTFDTRTMRWAEVAPPAGGGRFADGAAQLYSGTVVTYGGKGSSTATFGSRLFRRYDAAADTWTATTEGVGTEPGILFGHTLVELAPGRLFMLEGRAGTAATSRGYAWIYDAGPGSSDLDP